MKLGLLLLLPTVLCAQSPVRYRLTTSTKTSIDKAVFQPMIDQMKAAGADSATVAGLLADRVEKSSGVVLVTTRDSAGGTLWRVVVDSMVGDNDSTRRAAIAKTGRSAPYFKEPTSVYDVFVRDGNPVSFSKDGKSFPALPASNTIMEVLDKMPGFGLLIPNRAFPTQVGATRTDTLTEEFSGGAPAAKSPNDPPNVITWKRTSKDTIDARLNMSAPVDKSMPNARMSAIGTMQIVYDARQVVREARMSVTASITGTASGAMPMDSRTVMEYALVRIP